MPDKDPPIDPRSFFGIFARRAHLTFRKMSFLGVSHFVEDFQGWALGDNSRGYGTIVKDAIRDDNLLIRSSRDKQPVAEPESFSVFERAQANGDKQVATESLRRFFEQRFNNSTDSELRQHAMLNLVRMHMFNGQIAAARKLLLEAITVARTSVDNIVLQQCMALLRRTEGKTRTHKEPLNELQADIPPLEVLNDAGKLIREGQPISDVFEKIVQALGIYDLSRDFCGGPPVQHEQWSFHAIQSVAWRIAGCERLAIIEENIVLALSESGEADDTRFAMLQNRASMLSRQGKEAEAFGILLDPETWRGLNYSLNQVGFWSGEIWITMLHFASRRGQQRQINEFLKPRRPGTFNAWKDFFFLPLEKTNIPSTIEGLLYRALQTRKVNQAVMSVDHILKALWQAEYQGRFRLYRLAMILLADVGLEFGMTAWSRKLVEEVMPQIICGDDLELRSFACYVLARCIIACSGKTPTGLREAIPYLHIAAGDYCGLAIQPAVQDVLYVLAVVHNSLGEDIARDEAAAQHIAAGVEHDRLEAIAVNEHWDDILNLTSEICTALALRR
ncbi:hypothetical protein DFH11DRAFT_1575228 [Phellopilus nigrolimitatus]|nr:hypothetical protein DFH11DRAFT_1575228 [Phellopilus nigrolimitatus]